MCYSNFQALIHGDGDAPLTLLAIAARHGIYPTEYDQRVKELYSGSQVKTKEIDFNSLVKPTTGSYNSHCFVVQCNGRSNDTITARVVPLTDTDPSGVVFARYSYSLFRAVHLWFDVRKFEFTQAKSNGKVQIIFRGLNANGLAVYHGNMSHLFP